MDDVTRVVHNIDLVVGMLKDFPQTYDTILRDQRGNGTLQFILRRKLNKLCKEGEVCKTSIPGTRFGKAIFFYLPKNYYILVEASRFGSKVFSFRDYKKVSRFYMSVENCWELKGGAWVKTEEKVFFEGNTLKFI